MNSKTKIIVIRMRWLLIGGITFLALLIGVVLFIIASANDSGSSSSKNNRNDSKGNNNPAKTTASENITHTYTPGVYSASITLNGNPVDIQVTVDKNNINSIDLIHVSDAVTTMYPLLQTNFDEISKSVIETGSTQNITYSSDNKYTATMLLNAIQSALDKCTVK